MIRFVLKKAANCKMENQLSRIMVAGKQEFVKAIQVRDTRDISNKTDVCGQGSSHSIGASWTE